MQLVDRDTVVSEWLSVEQAKPSSSSFDIESNVAECERTARLFAHKPDAAAIFWQFDCAWFRTQLDEQEFRKLRTVWRDESDRILTLAQELKQGESSLSQDKQSQIYSLAAQAPHDDLGPLILHRAPGLGTGPFVDDGNHRAVALALSLLRGNSYTSQTAFIGYPAVAHSERLRGWVHQLIGRL